MSSNTVYTVCKIKKFLNNPVVQSQQTVSAYFTSK